MPMIYEPPLANPAPFGLFAAATVLDVSDPNRFGFDGGIQVRSLNCGPSGVWPYAYCEDPGTDTKGGDRTADPDPFVGGVVYAQDDCGILADLDEQEERAAQLLRLHERLRIEEHVASELVARSGAAIPGGTLVGAVGEAEEQLGQFGFIGVIHAAAHMAAPMAQANLIVRNGTTLTSPLGHKWAFGAGYDTLGDTLYLTGPVVIHRGAISTNVGMAVQGNERQVIAEREFDVTWECFTAAVTTAA